MIAVVCFPPSGVSRQAQPEAAEESEHKCELVPVLSRDGRHPAVHHRAGKHPAALCLQGQKRSFIASVLRLRAFYVH